MNLLAAVMLFLVMNSLATPYLAETTASFRRNEARSTIEADLIRARTLAAREGSRAILSISSDKESYSFGFDYAPYSDPPTADSIEFNRNLPSNITVEATQTIIFNSRGMLVDTSATLTTTTMNLLFDERQFSQLSIYPTGAIEFQ